MINYQLTIPIKRYYLLIGVFDCASLLLGISLLGEMSSSQKDFTSIAINSTIFIVLSLYALWFTFGKEEIAFYDDKIVCKKIVGFLVLKNVYRAENISSAQIIENEDTNNSFVVTGTELIREVQRAFPFWYRMGKIRFRYNNRNVTILNGINGHNQNEVIERLSSYGNV